MNDPVQAYISSNTNFLANKNEACTYCNYMAIL